MGEGVAPSRTAAARSLPAGIGERDIRAPLRCIFDVLGCSFELVRQTEWLALDDAEVRRRGLRERACGRIRVAGEMHIILASEPVVSDRPCIVQLLSQRELQIASQIALGAANKDIARLFGISHLTVAEYVRRICHKLGVHSRAAIAASIGSIS